MVCDDERDKDAGRAWDARGGKYAKDTRDEQFQTMNLYFAKAVESASAALSLHPSSTEALNEVLTAI